MGVVSGNPLKFCEMFSKIRLIVGDAAAGKIFRSIISVFEGHSYSPMSPPLRTSIVAVSKFWRVPAHKPYFSKKNIFGIADGTLVSVFTVNLAVMFYDNTYRIDIQ